MMARPCCPVCRFSPSDDLESLRSEVERLRTHADKARREAQRSRQRAERAEKALADRKGNGNGRRSA